jgi:nitrogen-specific signal transduction histidine kinase
LQSNLANYSLESEQVILQVPPRSVPLVYTDDGEGFPIQKPLAEYFLKYVSGSQGTGLGLWIMCMCAKYHNAGLSVSSKPGDTKITLHLPYEN